MNGPQKRPTRTLQDQLPAPGPGSHPADRGILYHVPQRDHHLAAHFGGNHIAILSAWLHDVFEDCDGGACSPTTNAIDTLPLPADDIRKIHAITAALTKNPDLVKEERIPDSLERIIKSLREAVLVKICDRIDNLIDADFHGEEFRVSYYRKSNLIADTLRDAAITAGYREAIDTLTGILKRKPE